MVLIYVPLVLKQAIVAPLCKHMEGNINKDTNLHDKSTLLPQKNIDKKPKK
jgi:hypothetical protein